MATLKDATRAIARRESHQTFQPHWSDAISDARRKAAKKHGPNFHLVEGAAIRGVLAKSERTQTYLRFDGAVGKRKFHKDVLLPVEAFWPDGRFPKLYSRVPSVKTRTKEERAAIVAKIKAAEKRRLALISLPAPTDPTRKPLAA